MYQINRLQGYIAQHREIQTLFYNSFKWNIIYKNVDSLCCTPETNIVDERKKRKEKRKKERKSKHL